MVAILLLVIALVVVAALLKLLAGFWHWATTTRRRAWIGLPFLFYLPSLVVMEVGIRLVLVITGLADFSNVEPPTDQQQFIESVVNWSAAALALAFSLLATGGKVRKLFSGTPETGLHD